MLNRFGVLNLFIAIGLIATVTAIDCNTHPDMKSVKECCPHDNIITAAIVEQCKSLKTEGGPHHGMGKCYAECAINATGIVDLATMEVNEAKAKTYLTTALKSYPDFVQVTLDALLKCAQKGKEMRAKMASSPHPSPPPSECKPCAEMLIGCIRKEIMINCPTSAWKNDETCNNAREFMMVCKPPHHKGPPPPA